MVFGSYMPALSSPFSQNCCATTIIEVFFKDGRTDGSLRGLQLHLFHRDSLLADIPFGHECKRIKLRLHEMLS